MSSIPAHSLHLSRRANWDWSEAEWQARAVIEMPASFVGLGALLLAAAIISVFFARGHRPIFATLTAAILVFVVTQALVLAYYLIQYLDDIFESLNTIRNISSASTVFGGVQAALDFVVFLLVLKDRKRALAQLPGSPMTKPAIGQRILNVLVAIALVILPVFSLVSGVISGAANKAAQAGSVDHRKYNNLMQAVNILGHVWTAAFGIAVVVLGVKAIALHRRLISLGLSDVPTLIMLTVALPILLAELVVHIFFSVWFSVYKPTFVHDLAYVNSIVAVTLLLPALTLAYYSVIISLGFMPKLWLMTPPAQLVPTKTAHELKSESISTV